MTTTSKIPQHKHCPVCGRATQVDEEFCGTDCKGLYDQRVAKKKQTLYLYIGAMIFMVAMLATNIV